MPNLFKLHAKMACGGLKKILGPGPKQQRESQGVENIRFFPAALLLSACPQVREWMISFTHHRQLCRAAEQNDLKTNYDYKAGTPWQWWTMLCCCKTPWHISNFVAFLRAVGHITKWCSGLAQSRAAPLKATPQDGGRVGHGEVQCSGQNKDEQHKSDRC